MTSDIQSLDAKTMPASRRAVNWQRVAPVVAVLDGIGIMAAATASSTVYYSFAYSDQVGRNGDFNFQLTIALFYVLVRALRGDYSFVAYTSARSFSGRICQAWFLSFVTLLAAVFLLKVGNYYSRGMAFSLFLAGPVELIIQQRFLALSFARACRDGRLAVRRVFVVGEQKAVAEFCQAADRGRSGHAVVGTFYLEDGSDPDVENRLLQQAVSRARGLTPDDILVALPLDQHARIQGVVEAFKVTPAAIQLGADLLLKRYPALRTLRAGDTASIELVREPLTPFEQFAKRCFDVVVSITALILLSPVILAAALAIKLTSPGPVFFRQERHCFNRKTFRIYKFRTMRPGSDAGAFRQATQNDPRITPIGAFLRRSNLDELPQLLNVLRGEMSIVGPRPHAIAHDQDFEQRISNYARRHNIKPGITGWAQVNGLRGVTDTDAKMRARVEHDLAYVEHWSLLFDFRIVLMTVFSASAYRNAV